MNVLFTVTFTVFSRILGSPLEIEKLLRKDKNGLFEVKLTCDFRSIELVNNYFWTALTT